jgi:hypothetical protein
MELSNDSSYPQMNDDRITSFNRLPFKIHQSQILQYAMIESFLRQFYSIMFNKQCQQ